MFICLLYKVYSIGAAPSAIPGWPLCALDISATDINLSGIYAYETLGGTKIQISNVSTMTDGNVRFYYTNKVYSDEIRTQNRLNDLDFKVIGRIIKNLSFIHT